MLGSMFATPGGIHTEPTPTILLTDWHLSHTHICIPTVGEMVPRIGSQYFAAQ